MKNIAVPASGGGANLQALIGAEKRGGIKDGKIMCVNAFAPKRAKKLLTHTLFDHRFEKGLLL